MPRPNRAQRRPDDTTPSFLASARAFYGPAFGVRREAALAEAMADWADLTPDEQSFAMAHLQYLGLLAHAGTQRLLVQVRDLLEELSEDVDDVLAALAPEPVDEAPFVEEEPGPELEEPPDVPEPEEIDDEDVPDDEEADDVSA